MELLVLLSVLSSSIESEAVVAKERFADSVYYYLYENERGLKSENIFSANPNDCFSSMLKNAVIIKSSTEDKIYQHTVNHGNLDAIEHAYLYPVSSATI